MILFVLIFADIFAAAEQRPCGQDREADQANERGHDGVSGDPGPGLHPAPAHLGALVSCGDIPAAVDNSVTQQVTADTGAPRPGRGARGPEYVRGGALQLYWGHYQPHPLPHVITVTRPKPHIHLVVLQLSVLPPLEVGVSVVYLGHLFPLLRQPDAVLTRLNVLTKLSTLHTRDKREISEIKDCFSVCS